MGLSWHQSGGLGPLRLNSSSSGVGASVGVRGARLSVGPRGTYVHLGAEGFRYSQRIDGPRIPLGPNRILPMCMVSPDSSTRQRRSRKAER